MVAGILILGCCFVAASLAIAMVSNLRWAQSKNWERWAEESIAEKQDSELSQRLDDLYSNPALGCKKRKFSVRIERVVQESSDCRSFYLVDSSGEVLPTFAPGQHLVVRLPIDPDEERPQTRCYSLSNAPGGPEWRITVKRQPGASQRTSVSNFMHLALHEGSTLEIQGPAGSFFLNPESTTPVVLIAAGVGVTPLQSMFESIHKSQPNRPVEFFYQVRDLEHAPFHQQLVAANENVASFNLRIYCSSLQPGFRRGPFHGGKFTVSDLPLNDAQQADFYLCGPMQWMQMIVEQLTQHGVPQDRIHFESFGQSANSGTRGDRETSASIAPSPSTQHSLQLKRQEKVLSVAANANLLHAIEQSDTPVDAGCRSGSCGACVAKVLQGEFQYASEPTCDLQPGEVALCVAEARGDLVIDL